MFDEFVDRWNIYYLQNRTDLLYGNAAPGSFTPYAYDNTLVVIKALDKYIKEYGINENDFNNFWNNSNFTTRFKDILHDISFIGLTGNVSFDINGDRTNGLFSFCNVDPSTGDSKYIEYVINEYSNGILSAYIDESLINWPKIM